ncbi:uncharacterized protein MONOS_12997 [Monocercomonoides exilis]|uniref:uncharacterized protein n=1 Tax=Monocercomonoides exilis TaxID=2049356 RepID=UPI0035595272|nr:hypothetical protein MONOS_12997 [Monocercomonoides exilis]|eukprot:MONOS_12997.1-p1 / transcript=MONOS_12997.1 / gene=MONOS_12997 / organism=Monocercomonoides_exilis_PA203 / gene_product=unspecified product / transcript_product=unspecified product / location=Mono_scaffold00764:21323-22185(+) / protein_length=91 / sequence_SO=supercontig / SO=protein_coding / is_pseudo=false
MLYSISLKRTAEFAVIFLKATRISSSLHSSPLSTISGLLISLSFTFKCLRMHRYYVISYLLVFSSFFFNPSHRMVAMINAIRTINNVTTN